MMAPLNKFSNDKNFQLKSEARKIILKLIKQHLINKKDAWWKDENDL